MNDLRYAYRMLVKNPGFTAIAVLTLALGISANTTIFSIINVFFLQPLPVKNPQELVLVLQRSAVWKLPHGHSWLDYQDYHQRVSVFSDLSAYYLTPAHISVPGGQPERTWIEAVSGNYFSLLGVDAASGRFLRPDEGVKPGADPSVVLSHGYWKRAFGGDPGVIGKIIHVNGHPFTVIGVGGPKFSGAQWSISPVAWIPATMLGQIDPGGDGFLKSRGAAAFKLMGRLKPGVTLPEARAAVDVVTRQLSKDFPDDHKEVVALVYPEKRCRPEPTFADAMPAVASVFMLMVGLVLFIACANVANLMFSRALVRQKEMGIRTALGASRRRLIRQLLAESTLLALAAGIVGLAIAHWTGGLLSRFTPQGDIPMRNDQDWGWQVFAFTFGMSMAAGAITGIVPALRATRIDVQMILKEGGSALLSSGRHPFRSMLVVSQVAICVVVLIAGGLFIQSLREVGHRDLGFRTRNLVMASFDLSLQGYPEPRARQFYRDLLEKVNALPGVRSASLASAVPFDYGIQMRETAPEGRDSKDDYKATAFNCVDARHLATIGATLVQGRCFSNRDLDNAPRVAVVNELFAQRNWPGENPLGKRFHCGRQAALVEVVGVVRNGRYVMIGEEPRPYFYVPLEQYYSNPVTLHLYTAGDPAAIIPTLRGVLREFDPHLPIYNVRTMEAHLRESAFGLMPLRMGATLAGVQGLLALALSVMGVYGLVAYVVSQRTREVGIRMALGAQTLDVVRLVVRDGLTLTLVGIGLGAIGAVGLTLLISKVLYGLAPASAPVFIAAILLIGSVALLACYIPARRAVNVDPLTALRYE
jgi:predicted permease